MGLDSWMWEMVPFAAMIAVECTDVAVSTISKAALAKGMSQFVSVVYYNALGTLLLLPYFIFHRKERASLTLSLLCRFFLLGFIGSTGQIVALTGINWSSPTLASAMANLAPIFTFLLAVFFGMEALSLRRSSSQVKSLGAVVSVTGALIVTLYKGPAILTISTPNPDNQLVLQKKSNWIFGGLLLALASLGSAIWNILQGATVKEYPEEMTIVFFFTFFITIQSAVFAIIFEREPAAWKLNLRIEIISIVCTAIFGSLFRIAIHTWCLAKKGPVYVAMFKPLGIVIAVFMAVTFLGDTLCLGSIIGSVIIALGFYAVIWGQIKEKNIPLERKTCGIESSNRKTPLLQGSDSRASEEA